MPHWKQVPTLKTLSLRKVAWPDAANKPVYKKKHFPTLETYVRQTLFSQFLGKTKALLKKKKKHNINTDREPINQVADEVINAWIRLSNFHQTRLNEIGSVCMFMRVCSLSTLDLLHEGFTLRTEKNFIANILPYIGAVPYTLKPQSIDFRTWFDLVNVMIKNGIAFGLRNLYIPFGNEQILREKHGDDEISEFHKRFISSSLSYQFEETLEYFVNLRTIIVRGEIIKDNFMHAVGENCVFLQHLDIRGTQVTDRGVALLLFRKLGKRFFMGTFLPTDSRFPRYPPSIKRACCSTLKYLDLSESAVGRHQASNHHHLFHMYITRACPQLRATPLRFYFEVPGRSRVIIRDLVSEDLSLVPFRQQLVNYFRQLHSERLFEFIQVLYACIHFENPSLEVIEDELGVETDFLFLSGSAILVHCKIEDLTVITLVSYNRNVLNFIPIPLLARFAPKLQKLKCSLREQLSEQTEMRCLRYLCCPMMKTVDTLKSIVAWCPALEYLEVKDICSMTKFGGDEVEQIFCKGAGEYESLEVLRLLFPNQILLFPGLTWIALRCPALRIVGDLEVWGVPYDTVMRIYANSGLYNYDFAIEHKGVLHFCDRQNKNELARFE